ncbi:MAG: ring-opening amidohydrolase [Geminicoccaceae bacterium]
MPTAAVHRIPAAAPDDLSGVLALIGSGALAPGSIRAVLGKTEGNGCVNDFTRAFAVSAWRQALAPHLAPVDLDAIAMVMSGGTEGVLAPHWLVLAEAAETTGQRPALAIGRARTSDLPPQELGRVGQVAMVAEGVRSAMRDAGIEHPADVHFVQIKVPLLTAARIAAAEKAGHTVATRDTLKSMGLSRGAAALGVALALGEVAEARLSDGVIGTDTSLYSSVASTSAGVELQDHEIVVLGMSERWSGSLAVEHAVMRDAIDVEPVRAALVRAGLPCTGQLAEALRPRLVALLAKAEAGSTGTLRGRRHTMLDDSDIASTRHARAAVGGALAALVGHGEIYVSGGAEHQGPDGGGPVAVIVARE